MCFSACSVCVHVCVRLFSVSVVMQGEQKYSEWIFPGWSRHGLVAGEYLRCKICEVYIILQPT